MKRREFIRRALRWASAVCGLAIAAPRKLWSFRIPFDDGTGDVIKPGAIRTFPVHWRNPLGRPEEMSYSLDGEHWQPLPINRADWLTDIDISGPSIAVIGDGDEQTIAWIKNT